MIQQALDGMITILMAKFMLNDLPHAAGLFNDSSLRVEQTIVDKVIDDLEHTWHRIDSDMSIRMQEALGILKEVMSYHYENEAVVVWDNGNLIGIAVYETIRDKDLGVQDTHISELASFTYEPGVGKLIVEKIIKIAKKEGSDAVTASYAAGKRGFYEKLGFVKDYRYPEAPTLLMYKVKSNNPSSLIADNDDYVVLYHGTSAELAERALSEGLTPQPGPETEFPSIYLAWSPVEAAKYGDTVLKVKLPKSELDYMEETLPEYIRSTYPIEAKYLSIHKSSPKSTSRTTKLYHCTDASNVNSIMKDGLLRYESGFIFFFPSLEVAEEAGISGMAILEVSITDDEVDKCIIGETFPELYTERIGGEPPADTTLREYLRNPIAYGIPEVCCTIDRIPVDRIKYLKTIRR